jgi:hypothetical protein
MGRVGAKSCIRFRRPFLKIYAMEMTEGGLSAVEWRTLQELGVVSGAGEVEVIAA